MLCLVLLYKASQFFVQEQEMKQAKLARYPSAGIDIPSNYLLHGIDISSYQGFIYWHAVKKMKMGDTQVDFVFIKATEGLNSSDKLFQRNWDSLKAEQITKGAYHFFLATKNGKIQARNFIRTVKLQKNDLPPAVDIEHLYGVPPLLMQKRMKECLVALEQYYGVKPVIYTNIAFYNTYLGEEFDSYPLWIANYLQNEKPRIERDWLFWQHSNEGHVNGIRTKVDFNVFYSDSTAFKKILIP
jgi:lysozyme